MRSPLFISWIALIIIACGGKAVIDPGGAGGESSASSNSSSSNNSSSNNSSSSNSSSSGIPQRCESIGACCDRLCDAAADLPCWDPGTDCECGDAPTVPQCGDAILALFQCMADRLPSSLKCFQGEVSIACGVCEEALADVPPDCGIDVGTCAP